METYSSTQIDQMKLDKDLNGLVKVLQQSDEFLKKEAVRAMGQVGTTACIKYLEKALKDEYPSVRAVALQSIGTLGSQDENTIPEDRIKENIINLLHDKNWTVRYAAVESLSLLYGEESLEDITPFLLDENPHVKEAVFQAMDNFRKEK